ncbi:uncharacterized protein BYT42DRAFT_613303 [Radiomyces spectabilis]|uniref:uncharacterized protein n=1 Tax=Radiomyces spectabilis TaxID=64574 RepID=UPI0022204051|nr:uncharacterized protein BYT42DRAFT_613303 [Radiomyces spectabilis]KAI8381531.1 hypothetical protein BYT42DRAFT_613303 [Radiomyces spectabilis]
MNEAPREGSKFLFNHQSFIALMSASIVASVISLIGAGLAILGYGYLWFYHRQPANRVSLRCVFLASVMNVLKGMFDIANVLSVGDTVYCHAGAVIVLFLKITSAALLAVVGLNLVLIFVINVKRSDLLELFYYPGILLYSFVTIVVPIYLESRIGSSNGNEYVCWYYTHYYLIDGFSDFFWMWFYGFVFGIIVIAVVCSVIAMYKLIKEFPSFRGNQATDDQTRDAPAQPSIFGKVVLRCILYPLVPFIVNIFGFVMQLLISSDRSPYALAMIDVIFSNLEGLFIACVFFSDPAIATLLKDRLKSWRKDYLDKFSEIESYDEGRARFSQTVSVSSVPSTHSKDHGLSPPLSARRMQPRGGAADQEGTQRNSTFWSHFNKDDPFPSAVPMHQLSMHDDHSSHELPSLDAYVSAKNRELKSFRSFGQPQFPSSLPPIPSHKSSSDAFKPRESSSSSSQDHPAFGSDTTENDST